MGLTDTIAVYLCETVLTKHSHRIDRSHFGIDAQRRGIELMIAIGLVADGSWTEAVIEVVPKAVPHEWRLIAGDGS